MISPGGSLANSMFGFPCDFDQESAHSARRRFAKERFVPNGNKKLLRLQHQVLHQAEDPRQFIIHMRLP